MMIEELLAVGVIFLTMWLLSFVGVMIYDVCSQAMIEHPVRQAAIVAIGITLFILVNMKNEESVKTLPEDANESYSCTCECRCNQKRD